MTFKSACQRLATPFFPLRFGLALQFDPIPRKAALPSDLRNVDFIRRLFQRIRG